MGLFINVLIAEDSKEISDDIKKIVLKNPAVKIVNVVNNGIDAYKTIINKKTDFAFIEFNLPLMSASEILRQLKKDNVNTKIIVLSTTDKNNDFNNRLINLGAFKIINKNAKIEYIEKEILNTIINKNIKKEEIITNEIKIDEAIKESLPKKIIIPKNTINTFPYNISRVNDVINKIDYSDFKNPKLIAIGISTGGPKALRSLIPSIPKDFPIPILISQHIPRDFSSSLAKGLNDVSQITVKEAEDNEEVKAGFAYICPGENNMGIYLDNNIKIKLREDLKTDLPYMPSVNHLFNTINDNLKDQAIAVIMTGMGNDGTEGMINLYNNKNLTIAQNKTTSTIFGMPKSAIENNAVHFIISLYDIADFLVQYTTIKLKGLY